MTIKAGERLRQLLKQPGIIIAPGVFNALTARLVERAGFSVVYVSGAGVANTLLAWPDMGFLTATEMLTQVRHIVEATDLPVIADIDTGYGNALNVYRTVRDFAAAGIAGMQLEDQVTPKRCGHFAGKSVISTDEMLKKIEVAREAQGDRDVVLIARTDAYAVHGLDCAIERAQAFVAAGADMTFVEAPSLAEDLERIPGQIGAPQVVNMVEGGLTPLLPAARLEELGFKMAVYANAALRAAIKGMQEVLEELARHGSTEKVLHRLVTMEERGQLTNHMWFKRLEQRCVVPQPDQSQKGF